jgi:ParB family transcriptional regulator, chromosome partitioning protein
MDEMADKQVMSVEYHCLQLRYAHLHAQNPRTLETLTTSIEQHGQLVPVIIVPEKEVHQWVLIDGYHRVKALKRLGKDTIEAEVWNCPIEEALMRMLRNHPTHTPGMLEEALVLHELHTHCGLSQQELAAQVGRKQSWVSGRLSLVENLPESIVDVLSKGALSLWVCVRILAPIARAIPEHAECLLTYLLKQSHSTREVQSFYDHYQGSNAQVRVRMVEDPGLFFKAQKLMEVNAQTAALKKGPEGEWSVQCRSLTTLLEDLAALAPRIFIKQERENDEAHPHQLLKDFKKARGTFDELSKIIEGVVSC